MKDNMNILLIMKNKNQIQKNLIYSLGGINNRYDLMVKRN